MSLEVILIDKATGKILAVASTAWGKVLCVQSPGKEFGVFKSTALGAVATTKIAEPDGDGSVELTDLILTTEKKAAAIITIQYNDGTNTATVLTAYVADAPVNIGMNFAGNWQGWQGAWVEVDVAGAAALGSIALGYIKRLKADSLVYAEWNARR